MKRLSIYVFLLLFTLHTPSQADDIRDFQIEEMSIGDSLLDYFSEVEIIKEEKTFYPSKKFYVMNIPYVSKSSIYQKVTVSIKNNDIKYKIYSIGGTIFYENNIKDCYKKKDKIVKELSEIFKDDVKKTDEGTFILDADSSGKSTATTVNFIFNSNDFVSIQCKDWSEKMNAYDRLKVSIVLEEYDNFINNEVWD